MNPYEPPESKQVDDIPLIGHLGLCNAWIFAALFSTILLAVVLESAWRVLVLLMGAG